MKECNKALKHYTGLTPEPCNAFNGDIWQRSRSCRKPWPVSRPLFQIPLPPQKRLCDPRASALPPRCCLILPSSNRRPCPRSHQSDPRLAADVEKFLRELRDRAGGPSCTGTNHHGCRARHVLVCAQRGRRWTSVGGAAIHSENRHHCHCRPCHSAGENCQIYGGVGGGRIIVAVCRPKSLHIRHRPSVTTSFHVKHNGTISRVQCELKHSGRSFI